MTDDRPSIERAARSWLEAGPTAAPDHAIEAALLRIQTTAQERDWRAQLPRRNHPMTMPARLLAAAIALVVVAVGGILMFRPGGGYVAGTPPPSPAATAAASRTPSPTLAVVPRPFDYSTARGRILMEHAGNAPDGSEASSDYHIDRHRFYWMDPATMTGATAVELLPDWTGSGTGKFAADISPDGRTIVFQEDGNDYPGLWTTPTKPIGIQLAETGPAGNRCVHVAKCAELSPAFGPGGMLAYVVDVGGQAWIQIDWPEGQERELRSTRTPSDGAIPDRLSVSPDGTRIAFQRVTFKGDTITKVTISVVDVATDRTTVLPIPLVFPGDPDWLPDGSRIILTDGPVAIAPLPLGGAGRTAEVYSVAADGSGLQRLTNTGGNAITATVTPSGQILYFNNYFWLVNPDGSGALPVKLAGDDLSDLNVGFGLIGHWVDEP